MAKPSPDLGAVFDAHMRYEFVDCDVDATMRTMTANPNLTHVPTLTGGVGFEGVRDYYRNHFIGHWPADTTIIPISRTVGTDQVVDEFIVCFTHDTPMDTMLPGVPPTGKYVELPHVAVVKFEGGKVAHEHIYWDQASLLVQVGLLDQKTLPVTGVEQAKKLRGGTQPMNRLLQRKVPS
jgi:carboxymethylenebutenolidase